LVRLRREADDPEAVPSKRENPCRVSVAGIFVGLILEVAVVGLIAAVEVPGTVFLSSWSIVPPALLVLVALFLLRRVLQRRGRPRPAKATAFLIYTMLTTTTCLVGYNMLQSLTAVLGGITFPPEQGGRWGDLSASIPKFLYPPANSVRGLFVGMSSVPWHAWRIPMLAWGGYLFAWAGLFMCLSFLLSNHWIRRDRLVFPIAAFPVELGVVEDKGRSSWAVLWFGIAVPVILETLLVLRHWNPAIPALTLRHRNISDFLPGQGPLSGLRPMLFGSEPFAIGLAFLVSAEISRSVSIFFIVKKACGIAAVAYGIGGGWQVAVGQPFPFPDELAPGAFVAFGAVCLWHARGDFSGALRSLRRQSAAGRRAEAWGVAGFLICLFCLAAFARFAGVSLLHWLAVLAIAVPTAVALSRLRAEAGPPWSWGPRNAVDAYLRFSGTRGMRPGEIAGINLLSWPLWDIRFLPMPHYLEGFKMGDTVGIRRGPHLAVLALAALVAIPAGIFFILPSAYHLGWDTARSYGGAEYVSGTIANAARSQFLFPQGPNKTSIALALFGGLSMLLLVWLREIFIWWPLHPVGFLMNTTWTPEDFWFPYLLGWMIKGICLRAGGLRLYRRFLPFFMGLVLGDLLTQSLWSAISVIGHFPMYQFVS